MSSPLIREFVPLREWTTFKVGGPARWFAEPASAEELSALRCWARDRNIPTFILGRGSNLVVSDRGFPGLVIHLGNRFSTLRFEEQRVHAQAGCLLHQLVMRSAESGLAGIENLAGIPGSVGGAVFINAGAFDQEIGQVISTVVSLDHHGNRITRVHDECRFAYRHSVFGDLDEWIIETTITLRPADPQWLQNQCREILRKRREKQPTELPNAGSMFKRPPGLFAGALIESCGLKGFSIGGAQVSPKHANFIVNTGNASARDIWLLSEEIIHRVYKLTGVHLEREVVFLGDFS